MSTQLQLTNISYRIIIICFFLLLSNYSTYVSVIFFLCLFFVVLIFCFLFCVFCVLVLFRVLLLLLCCLFPIFVQVYRVEIKLQEINIISIFFSSHCICVLCGSQNKQPLFPYTTLTDWFLKQRRSVFTARYGLGVYIKFSSIFVSEVLGRYPSVTIHLLYSTLQCVSIILYTNSLFTNTTVTKTTSECFSRQKLQKNQLDVSMQTFTSRVHNLLSWHKLYPGNIHMRVNTPTETEMIIRKS